MEGGARRTVEELLTLYTLEPSLKDVFVEGLSDVRVIRWFLQKTGRIGVNVYEIDSVAIPEANFRALGLEIGARGSVIALAHALAEAFPNSELHVACIADSDADFLLGRRVDSLYLSYTDYTCIEMYLFNVTVLGKFINLALGTFPHGASAVMKALSPALEEVFLIRTVSRVLQLNLPELSYQTFRRCCSPKGSQIILDSAAYLTRYLLNRGGASRWDEFLKLLEQLRLGRRPDPRYQMDGHYFADLLSWYIKHVLKHEGFNNPDILLGSLFTCLEVEHLAAEPLFRRLLEKFLEAA